MAENHHGSDNTTVGRMIFLPKIIDLNCLKVTKTFGIGYKQLQKRLDQNALFYLTASYSLVIN